MLLPRTIASSWFRSRPLAPARPMSPSDSCGGGVDGKPVRDTDISANAGIGTPVEQPGYHRFRVETTTPGPQTLHVSANVPGPTRVERTFNTSIKAMLERKVRGRDEVVTSTIAFAPQ